MAQTLIEALAALPRGNGRGFRFITTTGLERFLSYAAMEEAARDRAARFASRGWQKGDRLAMIIPDAEQFVLSFLGAVLAGIVPVPIYPRAGSSLKSRRGYSDIVQHIIASSGAQAALMPQVTHVSLANEMAVACEMVCLEDLLQGNAPTTSLPSIGPDDLCFLQYTSGSTGLPKGVAVTHANLIANTTAFIGPFGIDRRPDDIALSWLPLYHDMGLIAFVLGTLIHDIPTVLLPTEAFARRPGSWMELISRTGATVTCAPNFAYALVTRRTSATDVAALDLRRLRVAACGAEPVNADVMRGFLAHFQAAGLRPEVLLPCYGMAEATLAITHHNHDLPMQTDIVDAAELASGVAVSTNPSSDRRTVELVSCGHPFPGHAVCIRDEDGFDLPDRHVGEILSSGPSTAQGYHRDPTTTAATFGDGWLRTGDLGYMAEGRLFVCGRVKDVIIIRGANYYPHDIEWAAAEVPGVQRGNVVAFGVMQNDGERLVVCVEGRPRDVTTLRRNVAMRVTEAIGLPVGTVAVVPIGSLPKTSSGKVQRRRVRALFEAGTLGQLAPDEASAELVNA